MTFAESFTQLGEVLSGENRSGVRGEVGTAGAGIDPGLRLGPRCVGEVRSTRRREGPVHTSYSCVPGVLQSVHLCLGAPLVSICCCNK